jgi:hypothetical protein
VRCLLCVRIVLVGRMSGSLAAADLLGRRDEMTKKEVTSFGTVVGTHPALVESRNPKSRWAEGEQTNASMFRAVNTENLIRGFHDPTSATFLMAVARFEEVEGKVARIRSYNFNPEVLEEIAGKLGLVEGQVPYRFPMVSGNARREGRTRLSN